MSYKFCLACGGQDGNCALNCDQIKLEIRAATQVYDFVRVMQMGESGCFSVPIFGPVKRLKDWQKRAVELKDKQKPDGVIAAILNGEGHRTTHGNKFDQGRITNFFYRRKRGNNVRN